MESERLKRRWEELCKSLGVSNDMERKWWSLLHSRYSEPQRAYHTLSHLDEMFAYFEEHLKLIADNAAVSLAIFFHDVVYEPRQGSPGNELESGLVFDAFAQEALPPGEPQQKGLLATKVRRWIEQTAHHRCAEHDEMDCKLFMDFDMAVLGRPWPQYEEYSLQIRQEYAHVPEALYCAARAAFLSSFASQDAAGIFATELFRSARGTRAVENAAREAEVLRGKLQSCSLVKRLGAQAALRIKGLLGKTWVKTAGASAASILAGSAVLAAPVHAMLALGLPFSAAAGCLALQLGTSTYIRQPLPLPKERESGLAVIAGSFNPPHQGHLEMVRYLSARYEKVHAVIGVNPSKSYEVTPHARQELLRAMLLEMGVSNVEVVIVYSYIWRHAQQQGAKVMYRGLRSLQKDGMTEKFLEAQNIVGQLLIGRTWPIPTAYIQADARFTGVSSSLLRQRMKSGDSISDLVPQGCASLVQQCYAEKSA